MHVGMVGRGYVGRQPEGAPAACRRPTQTFFNPQAMRSLYFAYEGAGRPQPAMNV
jgi:hypothetical protein